MFFSSDFFFSLFGSEVEKSFDGDIVEFFRIVFYDEDLESSVTLEEVVEYEVRMVEEVEIDR